MTPAKHLKAIGVKLTIADISKSSGVAKGTLNSWFHSKRYIFDAILEKVLREELSSNNKEPFRVMIQDWLEKIIKESK